MNNKEKLVIDEVDLVTYRTDLKGWVDRHGYYHGEDETSARYRSCTHIKCKTCGDVIPKQSYTICSTCLEKKRTEDYLLRKTKSWDGESFLYSETYDVYLQDEEAIADLLEEHQCILENLRLLHCGKTKIRQLDSDDFADDLCEDVEIPSELIDAIDAFNAMTSNIDTNTWYPNNYAVDTQSIFR